MRKGRGVYYTPPPVVNFIVRAIDDILKDSFGIERGLADHEKVTVLDFACGTGTFLLEVFERVFDTIGGPEAGQADQIVREHLVKNLYGFEYLIAPYTIAHLKLSQYLKDKGHPLQDGERLQVFLTNTLEPVEPQRDLMLPALSREVEEAQAVKDKPILVITGNPPYSAKTRNSSNYIDSTIARYKRFAGAPLGERKTWLQDDYVKFLRFAEMKMQQVECGIVGFIANHSWLDNPTFRGMRESLMETFDEIYVLDLHGSVKRGDLQHGEVRDENVFDIEQGVAICIFVKHKDAAKFVRRGDMIGRRLDKYSRLVGSDKLIDLTQPIHPAMPFLLFEPDLDADLAAEYEAMSKLDEIFTTRVSGIVTARDSLTIAFNSDELTSAVTKFVDGSGPGEPQDTRGWSSAAARDSLQRRRDWRTHFKALDYKPFDTRTIFYDRRVVDWGRWNIMPELSSSNISLNVSRQVKAGDWMHAFVGSHVVESTLVSNRTSEIGYVLPLYIGGEEAISAQFRKDADARYEHHYTPEELLGYIYAILYAPTYRSRYAEFLRIDFPRIPFPETKAQFDALSDLGWALVQAHLLKAVPKSDCRLGVYHGKGDHTVEAVRWSEAEAAVWINKTQRFAPVPKAVWEFHIGGYQVLDKYLKSRKGRKLSLDETTHVGRVAETLAFTVEQMGRIDAAYLAAFPAVDDGPAPLAPAA